MNRSNDEFADIPPNKVLIIRYIPFAVSDDEVCGPANLIQKHEYVMYLDEIISLLKYSRSLYHLSVLDCVVIKRLESLEDLALSNLPQSRCVHRCLETSM